MPLTLVQSLEHHHLINDHSSILMLYMYVQLFSCAFEICFFISCRALIYPLLIKGGKPTPFIPFALAFLFCLYNGYMQGRYITRYAQYPEDWIVQPNFVAGKAASTLPY